jgi:hypothetical protein
LQVISDEEKLKPNWFHITSPRAVKPNKSQTLI